MSNIDLEFLFFSGHLGGGSDRWRSMCDQAAGVVVGSIDDVVDGSVDTVVSVVVGKKKQLADIKSGGKASTEASTPIRGWTG